MDWDLLRAISQHQKLALDFSLQYDERMFLDNNAQLLGRAFIDYVRTFKNRPTKRSMSEVYSSDTQMLGLIENFYNKHNTPYDEADYSFDLARLKQRFGETKIKEVKEYLNAGSSTDLTSAIKHIQKQINEVKSVSSSNQIFARQTLKDHIPDFKRDYVAKTKDKDLGRGILTGYSFLDYINNGFRPSDLVIIAAETGAGKSMFMSNMAIQTWMQKNQITTPTDQLQKGYNVTYFSLEMPYRDCFRRVLARLADVPNYGIRDATLTQAEAESVITAFDFIQRYPHEFDIVDVPRGFSVEQLELKFEEIKADYTPDIIFIDYMGLMEDMDEDSEDWLALGKLAGKIHEFARVYGIPVVTAVQLNRLAPSKNQTEVQTIGLHRIGRSSLMAQHATVVIQIESRPDEDTHDDFIYHIIKNRDGESRKKHTIWKNFSHSSITDKPYNSKDNENWSEEDDISVDMSGILGLFADENTKTDSSQSDQG